MQDLHVFSAWIWIHQPDAHFAGLYIHIHLLLYLLSLRPDVWERAGHKGHPPPDTNQRAAAARAPKRRRCGFGQREKPHWKGKEKQMKAGDVPETPARLIVWALLWKKSLEHRKGSSKDKEGLSKAWIKQEITGENSWSGKPAHALLWLLTILEKRWGRDVLIPNYGNQC